MPARIAPLCAPRARTLGLFALALTILLPLRAAPAATADSALGTIVTASDPRFVFEGRFDTSDSLGPVVIWQASRIRLDFNGDRLGLRFDHVNGQVYFNADIDGHVSLVAMRENAPAQGIDLSGLGEGRHHLVLFKRSEASAGTARFRGVELAPGAEAWKPALPDYAVRMLFIGDSITVGACNEDGPSDQWKDYRTHNAALSWATLTAQAFDADVREIAVSGMGIATGWYDQLAGDVWNRLYPRAASPRADLSRWRPDVVLINLGENDDSYTRAHGQPFPAGYTPGYVALVAAVRQAYPTAEIVLLRGGMYGGAQSEPLRKAWTAAVAEVEKSDPHISHFVFKHWTKTHPRVADDRIMAAELTAWLRTQGWWPVKR